MKTKEICNGNRVLIQRTPTEKEVATIKAIMNNGKVLVRDSTGEIVEVSQNQISKKFKS